MPDLNSLFRSVAAALKAEEDRSANRPTLSHEEKARLAESVRCGEEQLKALRESGRETGRNLDAYIQMAKPYVLSMGPVSAVRPDMDLLQDLYLRMTPALGSREAEELYRLASGGKLFLEREAEDLARAVEHDRRLMDESGLKASLPDAVERQKQILRGSGFSSLLKGVRSAYAESLPRVMGGEGWTPGEGTDFPSFACAWKNMHLLPECLRDFCALTGAYGTKDGRLAVPQAFTGILEFYPDSMEHADRAMEWVRAYAFNCLTRLKPIPERIFWIDAAMMNNFSLGILSPLEGTGVSSVPGSPSDITALLERLLMIQSDGKLAGRLLVARGVTEMAEGQAPRLLKQIIANCGHSGLRVILVRGVGASGTQTRGDAVIWLRGGAWLVHDGKRSACTFPEPPASIPGEAAERIRALCRPPKVSNRYMDYVRTDVFPERRPEADFPIELPYGLLNGRVRSVIFKGVDFAGYLLGTTGSGKSALLHTLIEGIVSGYHPDDVEIWLADMQNSSFAVYVRHMPPHIRYLVLDNSVDAVTAFIERVYTEHERRNRLRAARGAEQIWDLPREEVPPRAFVIVDEFGPLSDALADYNSEKGMKCRTLLTQLLQQGRKNGIHFLFAHQNYNNGVRGLTEEAKNQFGLRLLMRADTAELRACAAIADRTPEQDGIINSILPHQMAVRSSAGVTKDRCLSPAAQVLYINDSDMELLGRIADRQREEMRYAPKHPVVVDQSHRIPFSERKNDILEDIRRMTEEGLAIYPGAPRNMDPVQRVTLQLRADQSLIMLCDVRNSPERLHAAWEVCRAALNSAVLQNWTPEIWAGRGDPLSEKLAARYKDSRHFIPADRVPARVKELYDKLQRRERDRLMILIPDLPGLLTRLNDMEEEEKWLGSPGKEAAGSDQAAQDLLALANAFRAAAPPGAAKGDDGMMKKFFALVHLGSCYGMMTFSCADKDVSVFPKPLTESWFSNRLLFRSGSGSLATDKLTRTIRDDITFLYDGASDRALFTTFEFGA